MAHDEEGGLTYLRYHAVGLPDFFHENEKVRNPELCDVSDRFYRRHGGYEASLVEQSLAPKRDLVQWMDPSPCTFLMSVFYPQLDVASTLYATGKQRSASFFYRRTTFRQIFWLRAEMIRIMSSLTPDSPPYFQRLSMINLSRSALEMAWTKILGRAFPPTQLQELESIFSDRVCLEEFGFTRLHKSILGLEGCEDLPSTLAVLSEQNEIDALDGNGRTALSWAAQRGDATAVAALLGNGADSSTSTRGGMTPLLYTAEAQSPQVIPILIQHGANVHAVDQAGHNALHFTARHSDDLAYSSPLVDAGCDVDAMTHYDYSPLIIACEMDHATLAEYLIDHGAKVNRPGQYGKTPLVFAVEFNAVKVLSLLFAHGADVTVLDELGPTIAHWAARFARLKTVQTLRDGLRERMAMSGNAIKNETRCSCDASQRAQASTSASVRLEDLERTGLDGPKSKAWCSRDGEESLKTDGRKRSIRWSSHS